MSNKKHSVRCSHCDGSGFRSLTEVESDTIKAIGAQWSLTPDIRARLRAIQGYDTTIQALCNRLVDLHRLGLVERRARDGKSYEWRVL